MSLGNTTYNVLENTKNRPQEDEETIAKTV